MARIVLAQGTSHSPQLSIGAESWPKFEQRDRDYNLLLDRAGKQRAFEELVAERGDRHAADLTREVWDGRKARLDEGLDRLQADLAAADPDVVVIIGDDQKELLDVDNLPALLIYRGAEVRATGRTSPDKLRRQQDNEVRQLAEWSYSPEVDGTYPVDQALGDHFLVALNEKGFDLAQSSRNPGANGVGHAFAFPYERIFDRPRPMVPVMINTYFPPNQPTPRRCVELGQALAAAIRDYGSDETKVAVLASGGLSHHLIDEELDRAVLAALEAGDLDRLRALPVESLDGGTSEIRNWVTLAGMLEGLQHSWTTYEPCYRTLAGTGCGMAFASWVA
jgi:3-O-methylgallate 3,4-dioxygenase